MLESQNGVQFEAGSKVRSFQCSDTEFQRHILALSVEKSQKENGRGEWDLRCLLGKVGTLQRNNGGDHNSSLRESSSRDNNLGSVTKVSSHFSIGIHWNNCADKNSR